MSTTPLVMELIPPPDPFTACQRLGDLPFLLFLDSAADPEHLGRYSFLAADPWCAVVSRGRAVEVVPTGNGRIPAIILRPGDDALAVTERLLEPLRAEPIAGLPPFQGGAAGYIGYDWGAVLERLPPTRYSDFGIPDVILGLYDWVIAWDHLERRAWLISTGMPERDAGAETRAAARAEAVHQVLGGTLAGDQSGLGAGPLAGIGVPLAPETVRAPSFPLPDVDAAHHAAIRSTFSHHAYLEAVARVVEYIVAGDIFQANLSQRFEAPLREPPLALYGRLRERNPAPFAAYLDFGGIRVVSASPERFLRFDPASREVETRPIKGTRPRGTGPMHDAALGMALTESAKDQAENVMIVDLLRNDLSRVCRAGTVRVPELFALEHHPTVHHLVSTVTGELEPGRTAADLLRASFPGGSITGAPKVRAMEIIAELEPTRRGVYCGSIGYWSRSGALDTSIVIRTCLCLEEQVYFQAGGGIVADSDPAEEYQETLDKAHALMLALASS